MGRFVGWVGVVLVTFTSVGAAAEEPVVPPREPTAVDAALKRAAVHVNLAASASADTVRAVTDGAPIKAKPGKLGLLGSATAAKATASAGKAGAVDAPKLAAVATVPQGSRSRRPRRERSKPNDAQRGVLESLDARLAECLTETDAAAPVAVVLNATIAPSGEVSSIATVTSGGVSPNGVACVGEIVSKAKFAPIAEASTVEVRVVPVYLRARLALLANAKERESRTTPLIGRAAILSLLSY
jgi:hypothetical protein